MSDLLNSAGTLHALFWPRACAVLGASDNPSKIGGIPVRYFKEYGYAGDFYPINPTRKTVQGLPSLPSIENVEGPVDMAIMAVPEPLALEAAEACARKGVKALVTLTSGFAEVGGEGARRQRRLRDIGRAAGMRIVGPNCLGYFNPRNHVYGTFTTSVTHGMPKPGNVGMVSQSGAVGAHCFVLAREKGIGFSYWVTTGNEVDVDVAECIAFMAQDDDTDVICAYIEGAKDGARLEEALRLAFEAQKPVLVQKVGRSEVGARAAVTHTASLAGSDRVYDAVFERYNAHRCLTVDELIDITHAASGGVFPKGRNVAVASISGGAAVMMADAASDLGLAMEPLSDAAQRTLKQAVPFAAVRNPVDFTAQVYNDLSLITKNFDVILGEGKYDAVVGFFAFLAYSDALSEAIIERLKPVRETYPDALIILSLTGPTRMLEKFEEAGFPCIAEPYRALEVVAALARIEEGFGMGLPSTAGLPDAPKITAKAYNEIEAKSVLAEAGVPSSREALARSADEAVRAARDIGYPVVLKVASADIPHKTESGGVALGLDDEDVVRCAFARIIERASEAHPEAAIDGVVVGRMMRGGTEMILGVQRDPVFGPVVMAGLGGIHTEVLRDVAFRRAPFGKRQARAMIDELKGAAILNGARGRPKADIDALAEAVARLSLFAHENAAVLDSVDINPLLVLDEGEGTVALDALITTRA